MAVHEMDFRTNTQRRGNGGKTLLPTDIKVRKLLYLFPLPTAGHNHVGFRPPVPTSPPCGECYLLMDERTDRKFGYLVVGFCHCLEYSKRFLPS